MKWVLSRTAPSGHKAVSEEDILPRLANGAVSRDIRLLCRCRGGLSTFAFTNYWVHCYAKYFLQSRILLLL